MRRYTTAITVLCLLALSASAAGQQLRPRREMAKSDAIARPDHPHRLIVKFRDALTVRATADGLVSRTGGDLTAIRAIARAHDVSFSQLIRLPRETIERIERRAARGSGVVQPDLAGILIAHAPDEKLQLVAEALNASEATEFAYYEELKPPPPCEDLYPETPLLRVHQTYLDFSPGLHMTLMWQIGPTRGAGFRIADCEYACNPDHEDLCDVIMEPGQTIPGFAKENGWDDHGTAALGALVSIDNAYGCLGIVPEAQPLFFPEWTVEEGPRRASAIAAAIAAVEPGDVVLIEMQTADSAPGYGPAELNCTVWMLTRCAVDAGIVIVAAAGNGNQDLDGRAFRHYVARGDSGAIIVGAGSATPQHLKMSFSTFGSRVDVQGWGFAVFTLGYGNFAEYGGDRNQRYKINFAGTSSASAIVAGACIALQGLAEEHLGRRLAPDELRQLLIDTGTAQGGGAEQHIGPFPNLVAAARALGVPIVFRPGDVNGDELVDALDLQAVQAAWGPCAGCPEDLNGDGVVNVDELLEVLANWD